MPHGRSIHLLSRLALVLALLTVRAFPAAAQTGVGGARLRIGCEGCPVDSVPARVLSTKDRVVLLTQLDTLMRRFGEEPFGSADRARLEREIKAAVEALRAASEDQRMAYAAEPPHAFMRSNFDNVLPRGWIGLNLDGPHELSVRADGEYVRYFDYPEVLSVEPNSPAERAGLQRGDMVIAYDGSDLRQTRINVTRMFVPQKRLSVAVRRDGEPREYTVVVARAPEQFTRRRIEFNFGPTLPTMAPPPELHASELVGPRPPVMAGAVVISMNGVFGAAMSTVNGELAKALGLERGVLVTESPRGTPAAQAGLRPGDVIVRVAGHAVSNVPELRAAIMRGVSDGAVTLEVVREKKTRKVKVSW